MNSSMGGGRSWNSNQRIADSVDHTASQIVLACDMITNATFSFDAIQQELMMLSNQPVPPEPSQLMSLANRLQLTKRQIDDSVHKVKEFAKHIDSKTDEIQKRSSW
ncbi:hypothetical protein [Lysinibacillus cavernae]|uniref:hypothetical protein n=1 Tax=Lysinibacillus cavernae TaxID=2666135 RepID=UPI0012D92BFB|nr:hypothetical protein [Lysinibacillus cavernae]